VNHSRTLAITDAELEEVLGASFSAPCTPHRRSAWVNRVSAGAAPDLTDKDLCELATELNPAGTLATINGLLEGLALRYADDSATLAAVIAIQHYHLPNLLDERDAELMEALIGRR